MFPFTLKGQRSHGQKLLSSILTNKYGHFLEKSRRRPRYIAGFLRRPVSVNQFLFHILSIKLQQCEIGKWINGKYVLERGVTFSMFSRKCKY